MADNEGQKYDLIAAGFAEMRDSFYMEQKYIDLFLKGLPPKSHILDIGCGSGYPIASYLIKNDTDVTGRNGVKSRQLTLSKYFWICLMSRLDPKNKWVNAITI